MGPKRGRTRATTLPAVTLPATSLPATSLPATVAVLSTSMLWMLAIIGVAAVVVAAAFLWAGWAPSDYRLVSVLPSWANFSGPSFSAASFSGASFSGASGSNEINNIYKPPIQDNLQRVLGTDRPISVDRAPTLFSYLSDQATISQATNVLATPTHGPPLPVRVRAPIDPGFKQVGILVRPESEGDTDGTNRVLPLMGQWLQGDKWRYFTMLSGNMQTKLPVSLVGGPIAGTSRRTTQKKSCTSEYGCPELSNDDAVAVAGFDAEYKATLYENGTFW